MNRKFAVKTTYSVSSVKAMASANYRLYQAGLMRKIYGTGLVFLLIGQILTSSEQKAVGLVCFLIGCIILANGEFPAHQAAKAVLGQMGQAFPTIALSFFTDSIRIDLGKESQTIPYAKIEKINESRDFFFLFLGSNAAYVIDKTGFTKGNVNEFRTFIAKKTALKYESTSLMRAMFPPRGMKKKK